MGQSGQDYRHISMKVFIVLPALLAYASGAAQLLVRGAGQTSHQSVSKPFQGEHRSTVQSKAFGAAIASVSDSPNRLHGARGVIGHPIAHAIAHPVAHAAYAAPVVHAAPAYAAPVVHAAPAYAAPAYHAPIVHAAPAYAAPVVHAAQAYHAPVVHAAAGYATPDLAEVSPYAYNYAVADDHSGAAFNQGETNDGNGVVQGSYSVNLPDGRVQTVNYHANDCDGFVSEVSYEGTASYPEAVPVVRQVVAHAPLVAHAPVLAHPVAHAVGPAIIG